MAAAKLAIAAYYHEVGDFVAVQTTLVDSSDAPVDAGEVRGLSVTLLKREAELGAVDGLDKFWLDENLWFNVRFNRPPSTRRLTVKVECTERTGNVAWNRTVNVLIAEYKNLEGDLGDNRQNVSA